MDFRLPEKSGCNDMDDEDDVESLASASTDTAAGRTHRKTKRTQKRGTVNFRYKCHVKEDHGIAIYSASFNYHIDPLFDPVFATVGANRVTVYKCCSDGSLLPQFVHADSESENFYTCAWSYLRTTFVPVLAVAGSRGIIRIIYCYGEKPMPQKTLIGHAGAVNEIKFHPTVPELLLSASKDHGLRLWNIESEVLVAAFGASDGHRDEVLGADIHCRGLSIVSCGMDHSLKIWRLDEPVQEAVKKSFKYSKKDKHDFPTLQQHFPHFTTREIHHNYVDCVAWFGNSVVSKSCEFDVKMWRPEEELDRILVERDCGVDVLTEFQLRKKTKKGQLLNLWYLKFSFNKAHTLFAVGDGGSDTKVYDMRVEDPMEINSPAVVLKHSKCVSTVRATAFSYEGDILITTCDDGTVWRWDRVDAGHH